MRLFLLILVASSLEYSVISALENGTVVDSKSLSSGTIGNLSLLEFNTTETDFQPSDEYFVANSSVSSSQRPDKDEGDDKEEDGEYDEEGEESDGTTTPEDDSKFISKASEITLEHIDFVMLRLKHISKQAPSNITALRALQKKEFKLNKLYKEGWDFAKQTFEDSLQNDVFAGYSNGSIVRTCPIEYHIALTAYTLHYPEDNPVYADFNKKTREVCSGKDIDKYHYKSFFKLLQLAIKTLGGDKKFKSATRFLYRGVGSPFGLDVGQILAFQQFVSTSSKLMAAENFAGKTLFEVQGHFDTGISVRDHSLYAEDEVLFSPLQVYEVESMHVGKYYTRYVLISHTLPGCNLNDDEDEVIGYGSMTKGRSTPAPGSSRSDNQLKRSLSAKSNYNTGSMIKGVNVELIVGIAFVKMVLLMN